MLDLVFSHTMTLILAAGSEFEYSFIAVNEYNSFNWFIFMAQIWFSMLFPIIFYQTIFSGGDAYLEQMDQVRDLQEKLAQLHFELEEEDIGQRFVKTVRK